MEIRNNKTLTAVIITVTVAAVIIIMTLGIAAKDTDYEPSGWVLRSHEGTVVLFYNDEINTVFGEIVIDNLPPDDVKMLENGIVFPSKEEALSAIEDYDG